MSDDFRDKLRSLSFSIGKHPVQQREDRLSDDLDAYQRLRKNGVQPKGIDGSADLEKKARDEVEIKYGLAATEKGLKHAKSIERDLNA